MPRRVSTMTVGPDQQEAIIGPIHIACHRHVAFRRTPSLEDCDLFQAPQDDHPARKGTAELVRHYGFVTSL
jgi:hypothetical protein